MNQLLILPIIFTSLFAQAKTTDLSQSLVKTQVKKPLINEHITIKPLPSHHFNLEAPQDCGKESAIETSARSIQCQFHTSGSKKVTVSVCDDKKSFCKQEYLSFEVKEKKSTTPRILQKKQKDTQQMQTQLKKKLMADFLVMTPNEARQKIGNKKGALVLVSTEWCPPCNAAKEFLISTQEFKDLHKDILLIYVDGDSSLKAQWQPLLQSFYYPTFAFLNKDLQPINLMVGYQNLADYKNWLSKSINLKNDPLIDLRQRIDKRLSNNFLQKVKDYFTSNKQKQEDIRRLFENFESRSEQQELFSYTQKTKSSLFKMDSLFAQYNNTWFGKKSSGTSPEDKNKKLLTIAKEILSTNKDINSQTRAFDKSLAYIFWNHCQQTSSKESQLSSEECDSIHNQRIKNLQREMQKNKEISLQQEKILDQVRMLDLVLDKAKLNKASDSIINGIKDQCFTLLDKLTPFTPLGDKSRTIKSKKLNCLSSKNQNQNIKLIKSLVKDYPYESTFHKKLAQYYLKKKNYPKALESINQAIKYSYGDNWATATIKKVQILKVMKKTQAALELINESLDEVVLSKDNKKQWWLNSLRAQQKDLQQTL